PSERTDMVRRHVESDCTSDDPCAKRAYEIAEEDLRGSLHQARLDALLALRSPTLALGAVPFHCERATKPVVEPFVHASAQCMRMACYEASLDLAQRGTRLIGGTAANPAFDELGRNVVFSLL